MRNPERTVQSAVPAFRHVRRPWAQVVVVAPKVGRKVTVNPRPLDVVAECLLLDVAYVAGSQTGGNRSQLQIRLAANVGSEVIDMMRLTQRRVSQSPRSRIPAQVLPPVLDDREPVESESYSPLRRSRGTLAASR